MSYATPRSARWLALAAIVVAATACTADSAEESAPDATDGISAISVTVPAERLTPFCQGMIDLTDQLRDGQVDDAQTLIVESYRELLPEVPEAITDDFSAVLAALESGAPPPTDPPTTTPVPSVPVATGADAGSQEGDAFFDEGYGPSRSPSERINAYVGFACRDTENNPGPPPTEPLEDDPTTDQ